MHAIYVFIALAFASMGQLSALPSYQAPQPPTTTVATTNPFTASPQPPAPVSGYQAPSPPVAAPKPLTSGYQAPVSGYQAPVAVAPKAPLSGYQPLALKDPNCKNKEDGSAYSPPAQARTAYGGHVVPKDTQQGNPGASAGSLANPGANGGSMEDATIVTSVDTKNSAAGEPGASTPAFGTVLQGQTGESGQPGTTSNNLQLQSADDSDESESSSAATRFVGSSFALVAVLGALIL